MNTVYTRKRQNKNGTSWEWRFELPRIGGKRKQCSKSGYNSEAEALSAGYLEFNRFNSKDRNARITIDELISEYTDKILYPNLKKGTVDNYRALIVNHISPSIGTLEISDITSGTILTMYNDVRLSGVSKFPLESIRRILNGAFEYAQIMGYMSTNPVEKIQFPKSINKSIERTAYTPQEIKQMAELLPSGNDRRLPFMIAALTGMRESEIASLKWSDVDLENHTLTVSEQLHCSSSKVYFGPVKNGGARVIPFGPMLEAILKEAKDKQSRFKSISGIKNYRDVDGNLIRAEKMPDGCNLIDFVCTKADGSNLHTWDFKAISAILKSSYDNSFSFHALRHSHCTTALDAGATVKAVADRMGHKDVRTTLAVYTHVSPSMRVKTAELVEKEFSDKQLELVVHTA